MRRWGAAILLSGLVAIATTLPASTQEPRAGLPVPRYFASRAINIPVNVAAINPSSSRPTHLQLYYRTGDLPWQAGSKLPLDGLDNLGGDARGFKFNADKDGEYEFSVLAWYGTGKTKPERVEELTPVQVAILDTTLPVVRITARGNGVEWEVIDANLDPRSIELQAKRISQVKWQTVPDGPDRATPRVFRATDSYDWKLQPGDILDVRVKARDLAGNEAYSLIVRVPGGSAIGTAFPRPAISGGDSYLPVTRPDRAPRIEYVSSQDITVTSAITHMGRSGIRAARLYVMSERLKPGWNDAGRYEADLKPEERNPTLSLRYQAKDDGTYGFYVAPESGAGEKAPAPGTNDPPMLYVVVDTALPYAKITDVRVMKGTGRGPVVMISWETYDVNLTPTPVSLDYAVAKDPPQWTEIKSGLSAGILTVGKTQGPGNQVYAGHYNWEVPEDTHWRLYIRLRVQDKAGNLQTQVWGDAATGKAPAEVLVDVEVPAAEITSVRGGPGGSALPLTSPGPKQEGPNSSKPVGTPGSVASPEVKAPTGDRPNPVLPILPMAPNPGKK